VQVVILAGGLGTRLHTEVADRPKALAPVAGRPFIDYQLDRLRTQGFRDILLCVGHGSGLIHDHVGDGSRHGVSVTYNAEAEPLGTAGAVGNARALLQCRFLLLNGDSFIEADLRVLVDYHARRTAEDAAAIGSIGAVHVPDVEGFGALQVAQGERIQRFTEKDTSGPGWINGGAYVLERSVVDLIPDGRASSIEQEIFPEIIAGRRSLYACRLGGQLIDIGTPEGYRRFQAYVASAN